MFSKMVVFRHALYILLYGIASQVCKVLAEVEWPPGSYALPKSIYGCPDPSINNWHNGYMNISFKESIALTESYIGRIGWNEVDLNVIELLGPYGSHSIQLNFCSKRENGSFEWPPSGQYGVYGTEDGCPQGQTDTFINRTIPEILSINRDGYLPDIHIYKEDNNSVISFRICQKLSNDDYKPIHNHSIPFIVLTLDGPQEAYVSGSTSNHRQLFITTGNGEQETSYEWIGYIIANQYNEEVEIVVDTLLIENYPSNVTAFYSSERIFSDRWIGYIEELAWAIDYQDAWALYDLGIGAVISAVRIWGWPLDGLNIRSERVPEIYISELKWQFLVNGALKCIRKVYTDRMNITILDSAWILIHIQCVNAPVGRYVSLVYPKIQEERYRLHDSMLQMFHSTEVSPRCMRPMGMQEGAILDDQLTASSSIPGYESYRARPDDVGWCAYAEDTSPYLQVDFGIDIKLEGIQIFNRRDESTDNEVISFTITYGSDMTGKMSHSKEFILDRSLSAKDAQIFIFASPISMSYIRVYPKMLIQSNTLLTCIRLELIGCQAAGECLLISRLPGEASITLVKLQCLPSNSTCALKATIGKLDIKRRDPGPYNQKCSRAMSSHWMPTETLYVPHKRGPSYPYDDEIVSGIKIHASSADDCLNICTAMSTKCYSSLYNTMTGLCEMYIQSDTNSYILNTISDNYTTAYIRSCDAEEYVNAVDGFLSNEVSVQLDNSTASSTKIVVSSGYPLYYPIGAVSLWKITSPPGTYVTLLFSNISLNTYKEDPLSGSVCKDEIYLVTHNDNSLFRKWILMSYTETGKRHDHELNFYLTDANNNRQLKYKEDRNDMTVTFRTCSESNQIIQRGSGFRLVTYYSVIPTCLPAWDMSTEAQFPACEWRTADISSASYLGLFFPDQVTNVWRIQGNEHEYVSLSITDFDIGCESGTLFEVTNGNEVLRYCNLNRPVYPIVSSSSLILQFRYKTPERFVFIEFFKGQYRTDVFNQHLDNLANSNEAVYDGVFKVCSDHFNKCYILIDILNVTEDTSNSWDRFNLEACEYYNWTMVDIHSKLENDFVEFILQHRLQYLSKRHLGTEEDHYGYAYLGLRRNGSQHVWSNGSPVIYTNWKTDNPSKNHKIGCTRMDIRSLTGEMVWDSIPCDQMQAEFGVCEYRIKELNETSSLHQPDETTEDPISWMGIERSLYFECGDGEIISILGRCNGIKDCLSGTDEEKCVNSSSCSIDQYQCDDGVCVSRSVLCDYNIDCASGEDEDCSCDDTEFRCNTKRCISMDLRCDAKPDCLQGEDEIGCSSCNPERAYSCGDYTCIPLEYRCDGVPDCLSGYDETDCVKPNSCQQWWNAGYRDNGMYEMDGNNVIECVFDEVETTGLMIAKYHSMDYLNFDKIREFGTGTLKLSYGSVELINRLHNMYTCYQSVDELCQPWIQELYDVDRDGTGGQNVICQCLQYKKNFQNNQIDIALCNGTEVEGTTKKTILKFYDWGMTNFIEYIDISTLFYSVSHTGQPRSELRIKLNPIECFKELTPQPRDIVCGNGITSPMKTKCLYDKTEYDTYLGCRNLANLQDCESFKCPSGYSKCPGSFCIEKRFVCDGVYHCEHGEDESDCGSAVQRCPSNYRCLQSNICLDTKYLCDGYRHCPLGDDERFCNFRCPEGCNCVGMAAECQMAIPVNSSENGFSTNTKSIDISANHDFFGVLSNDSSKLFFLNFLNISFCGITDIPLQFFDSMKNLLILDLSYNNLHVMKSNLFINQQKLSTLLLTGNTEIHHIETGAFEGLFSLRHFELTNANIRRISTNAFNALSFKSLDLSYNQIGLIENGAFGNLLVENIYFNGTLISSFSEGIFAALEVSQNLVTEEFRFCCVRPANLAEENCFPHKDEFSSCSDLMRNAALRSLLWVIGMFSLLGNITSLLYRFIYDRERLKLGYGVFVTNLAISDFLMGVYLIIIASADVAFRGSYIYNDEAWRSSFLCRLAGFLVTVSSEASVLFICLITIDRLLVIKYPFGQVRFTTKSSLFASCIVWFVVIIIAVLPFAITSYFKDAFYSKSGVCLALPLTRDRQPGWVYSISIFIAFNFLTFLGISFGQWMIYSSINSQREHIQGFSTARRNDLKVARNLLLVASTDFLCWFPVGILGILALNNHVISGDVYAWTAVLVLPINSALNPFLYTLSTILGRGKFTPDTAEQERKQMIPIDALHSALDVWNNTHLVRPGFTKSMVTLTDYMKDKKITIRKLLAITIKIAECLDFLHRRGLVNERLSLDCIWIESMDKPPSKITMSLQPKFVLKEEEKREEIKAFGNILAALMKQCAAYRRHQQQNITQKQKDA